MTDVTETKAERPKLGGRLGVSRKLLERKAAERAAVELPEGAPLESDFPGAEPVNADGVAEAGDQPAVEGQSKQAAANLLPSAAADPATAPVDGPAGTMAPVLAQAPAAPQPWSDEDESAFQALAARRKVAGYQRRGRNVDGQLITAGNIKPNGNTVVAVIVGLVAERGSVGRAELLDVMASANFPHRAARPDDRGWCQGYVAGALRDGFLALAEQPTAAQLVA